jgi:hypothetical protein
LTLGEICEISQKTDVGDLQYLKNSLIGKFQNWVEMKVNYPNNKRNTQRDFSDNFHNIKNFVPVDHFENISKNLVISSFDRSRKTTGGRKNFAITKNECI